MDLENEDDDILNEDIIALKDAWRDERCSPSLLPHQEDLLNRVLVQVETEVCFPAAQWNGHSFDMS